PSSEQRIEVFQGELHLYVAGRHVVVGAGEALTVPPGTTHYQWNPGEEKVVAEEGYYPPGRLHDMFATFFQLSSEGMLRR
ncbi:MAG: cupin domain-containing protein, partial [Akkermansiaceae bacterium]|nr:cupin domain-containing protein [Akkermansiaceae bacterium]